MRLRLRWPAIFFALTCSFAANLPVHAAGPEVLLDFSAAFATDLPLCPPGGASELQPSGSTGHHKVTLSWNAAPAIKGSPVGYCIYRSKKKGAARKTATCKECELVNKLPIMDTSCVDDLVKDGAEYYYVVIAITTTGASSPSNETPASIPATKQALNPQTNTPYSFCRGAAAQ